MLVAPIKTQLKAPGSNRLNLKCDELLSSFGFNFNLRRYPVGPKLRYFDASENLLSSQAGSVGVLPPDTRAESAVQCRACCSG